MIRDGSATGHAPHARTPALRRRRGLISNEEGTREQKQRDRCRLIALVERRGMRDADDERGCRFPRGCGSLVRQRGPAGLPLRYLRGERRDRGSCAVVAARGAAVAARQPGGWPCRAGRRGQPDPGAAARRREADERSRQEADRSDHPASDALRCEALRGLGTAGDDSPQDVDEGAKSVGEGPAHRTVLTRGVRADPEESIGWVRRAGALLWHGQQRGDGALRLAAADLYPAAFQQAHVDFAADAEAVREVDARLDRRAGAGQVAAAVARLEVVVVHAIAVHAHVDAVPGAVQDLLAEPGP